MAIHILLVLLDLGIPETLVAHDGISFGVVSMINAIRIKGGSHGSVYKAQFIVAKVRKYPVAVKVLEASGLEVFDIQRVGAIFQNAMLISLIRDLMQRTKRESKVWRTLRHENVVRFKGIFVAPNGVENRRLFLVSEWATLGNALDYLRLHPENSLSFVCLLIIYPSPTPADFHQISDFAEGLTYLHGQEVCHMDLKPVSIPNSY